MRQLTAISVSIRLVLSVTDEVDTRLKPDS